MAVTWKRLAYFTDIVATKLDDFAAPDDNTDLDASNARHGLLKKLIDDTTKFLRSDGGWQVPAGAALSSKIIASTRSMTAASGDVAYTGVGFTPTVIIALAYVGLSWSVCIGFSDSVKGAQGIWVYNSSISWSGGAYLIGVTTRGGYQPTTTGQLAIVKSYDADGFTLTWTKSGSPDAGTITLYLLCLK